MVWWAPVTGRPTEIWISQTPVWVVLRKVPIQGGFDTSFWFCLIMRRSSSMTWHDGSEILWVAGCKGGKKGWNLKFCLYMSVQVGWRKSILQRGVPEMLFHTASNLRSHRLMPKGTVLFSLFSFRGICPCLLPWVRSWHHVAGGWTPKLIDLVSKWVILFGRLIFFWINYLTSFIQWQCDS